MFSSSYSLFLVSIACLVLTRIVIVLWRRRKLISVIDKIPGPKGVPLLGVTWRLVTSRENVTKTARALTTPFAEKYPLIRIWAGPIPLVILFKAEAVKVLLSSTKQIDKAIFYRYLHNWIGLGLLTSTGSKWQHRRKLITPSFHFRILENFLLVMNEQADILVKILGQKCQQTKGKDFDIYPIITRCTLDIICETAMGQGVKAQLNVDSEYVNAVNNLSQVIKQRMMKPWLSPDWIFRWTSQWKLERESLKIVHGFTNKIIKMKRNKQNEAEKRVEETPKDDVVGLKRRVALLDMLLESEMTDEDIREEVDTFMFEGHDTTSVGIGWNLYCIGQYPEVQEKIVQELNTVFGDSSEETTSNHLNQLKYLECVIKESMRLLPPVPSYGRTTSEEMEICGYKVPANVPVIVATYYVHRDPVHFPDPDRFDPDRFLPEISQNRDPYAYVPFSAGLRNCIGQKFAFMEMKVVLSRILRNFVVVTTVEEDFFSNVISELVLRPIRGIRVTLKPRN